MLFGRAAPVDTIVASNRADADGRLKHSGGGINNRTGHCGGGTVILRSGSSVTDDTPMTPSARCLLDP